MSDHYSTYLKISAENENTVEQFINTIQKNALEGSRYGVEIDVKVVEPAKHDLEDFSSD